jgi:PhzF family phenazine biosynthesis protein
MKIKLFQVDAFADKAFTGNPAAVCVLDDWLPDEQMQSIAAENNLSETAFTVKNGSYYDIRWFTPVAEVDLCGHATLATAWVLFAYYETSTINLNFQSRKSGMLSVIKYNDLLTLDFPADIPCEVKPLTGLVEAVGKTPVRILQGKTDYVLIYKNQDDIDEINPDFNKMGKLPARGVIVSAPGNDVDFVSRFFGPAVGVNEDPVTGSAHTTLIPYWAGVLGKTKMAARQLSQRGGNLLCELKDDRVKISGGAVLFMEGEIFI